MSKYMYLINATDILPSAGEINSTLLGSLRERPRPEKVNTP